MERFQAWSEWEIFTLVRWWRIHHWLFNCPHHIQKAKHLDTLALCIYILCTMAARTRHLSTPKWFASYCYCRQLHGLNRQQNDRHRQLVWTDNHKSLLIRGSTRLLMLSIMIHAFLIKHKRKLKPKKNLNLPVNSCTTLGPILIPGYAIKQFLNHQAQDTSFFPRTPPQDFLSSWFSLRPTNWLIK